MPDDLESSIKDLVTRHAGARTSRITLDTTIFGDLKQDGLDGPELMEAFGREFNVDLSRFDARRHFGPEACGCNPIAWILAPFVEPHRLAEVEPISIRDMVEAAKRGHW